MEYVKNLKKANSYFSSFVANILGSDINLTVLQYILSNYYLGYYYFQYLLKISILLDNGNTTYYEYLYGEKPSKIEEAVIAVEDDNKVGNFIFVLLTNLTKQIPKLQDTTADEEIDWGDLDSPSDVCYFMKLNLLLSIKYIFLKCRILIMVSPWKKVVQQLRVHKSMVVLPEVMRH